MQHWGGSAPARRPRGRRRARLRQLRASARTAGPGLRRVPKRRAGARCSQPSQQRSHPALGSPVGDFRPPPPGSERRWSRPSWRGCRERARLARDVCGPASMRRFFGVCVPPGRRATARPAPTKPRSRAPGPELRACPPPPTPRIAQAPRARTHTLHKAPPTEPDQALPAAICAPLHKSQSTQRAMALARGRGLRRRGLGLPPSLPTAPQRPRKRAAEAMDADCGSPRASSARPADTAHVEAGMKRMRINTSAAERRVLTGELRPRGNAMCSCRPSAEAFASLLFQPAVRTAPWPLRRDYPLFARRPGRVLGPCKGGAFLGRVR